MKEIQIIDNATLIAQIPLRHSVRSYTDQAVEGAVREQLEAFIGQCNELSGLSLQLVVDEPGAFSGMLANYGSFRNVRNYIACVGPKGADLPEKAGYWGERCVLAAQALGLNTCWVALTYSKRKVAAQVASNQKLVAVIALGYGTSQGKPRKSKSAEQVSNISPQTPEWFDDGVIAALLAPTAMNQQKFLITYESNDEARIKDLGGAYSKIDLGIVKAHFELASQHSLRS